ncbi:MAG: hypothetical protein KBC90_18035 [Spirochaetes bacterium]|nr:hypothetical protein [Spirochaetota bacterium]
MINQYGFYIPFFEEHGIIYWESIVCVAFIIIILVLYYLRSLKKIMSNNHIKFNADEKSTYNGEVKDSIPNGKGSMIYNNSDFEDSHRINISRVVSKNLSKSDIRYLKDVAIDSIDRTTGDINYYITIREFTGNWKMGVWHGGNVNNFSHIQSPRSSDLIP